MGLNRSTPLKRTDGLARGEGLKRTQMERKADSLVRSELKRGDSTLVRTPLKPRSDKRAAFMKDHRIPLIKQLAANGHKCAIGPILARSGVPEASLCTRDIQGIHELRKRSAGGSLTNPVNLLPACNYCNGLIEDMPDTAHQLGLVIRPGDATYEELGASHDD